eukprot:CAMPEP_0172488422 /NCGR_PEP_ID=MMETSP1066-20121228/17939_1 /TAXON_ID=671091 /ORGANISM="Coscinodiscus wailesii, Strain CCMP2513" /LENGTH=94 /DNA_ID=CAMNT_0013255629 /DNA_START=495 /DNA_END=779 /DNA_ORIENTATION=+
MDLALHRRLSIYSGLYTKINTDYGFFQTLNILCTNNNDKCDITLVNISFSMCAKVNNRFLFGNIAYPKKVSIYVINNFRLNIYLLQLGKLGYQY